MPRPRQPLRIAPHEDSLELSGLPRLRDLIPDWHDEAVCAKEPDERMVERSFFYEAPLFAQTEERFLSSPSTTYVMLLCAECPVRTECLRSALDPPRWAAREDDIHTLGEHERAHRVFGVWGGTVELERHLLRDLPVEEAIDLLERTFPERLRRRLDSYWAARDEPRPNPNRPGEFRTRPLRKRDKRIDEMLAARGVTATASRPATLATCRRCSEPLGWRKRSDARWCSRACRQAAWRRRRELDAA